MTGKVAHIVERKGRYFARLVVPNDVRHVIGKTELRAPLGSNRSEASKKSHAVLADFQKQIESARAGLAMRPAEQRPHPEELDIMTFEEIARLRYRESLEFDEELRNTDHRYAAFGGIDEQQVTALKRAVVGSASDSELRDAVGSIMLQLALRGHHVEKFGSGGWRKLARYVAAAELEALRRIAERDEGDFSGSPQTPFLIAPEPAAPNIPKKSPVPLTVLFESYIAELAASGKGSEAKRRWTPVFRNLASFLGHEDAGRITPEDLVRWKESLLPTLAPKTIKDVYIVAVKAVLSWAKKNHKIPEYVAADLSIRAPKKVVSRERGLNDSEAAKVLAAALNYSPKVVSNPRNRESEKLTAAKKWVPWLCALTGARVAEITQLRKSDVRDRDGISYLHLTPDAGSIKTGHYRDVPIHPQLVELGFLDFVEASGNGPLFFAVNPDRSASAKPARQVAGRISDWLRGLDAISAEVDPSHAWRHRFKTIARELGLDPRVVDAIQGHASRTAGDDYGDVTLKAKHAAISRMPHYRIPAS